MSVLLIAKEDIYGKLQKAILKPGKLNVNGRPVKGNTKYLTWVYNWGYINEVFLG
jgi:hypothetical protein